MKRIAECDKYALYQILENVGINMKDLAGTSRSTQELVELYSYLLRMQLTARKAGKNHREIIRDQPGSAMKTGCSIQERE